MIVWHTMQGQCTDNANLPKATQHKERLTALYIICPSYFPSY
jgi:deoxyribodipyrimidine photolyase